MSSESAMERQAVFELAVKAANNDEHALRQLLQSLEPVLYRIAGRIAPALIDDAVQCAFIRIWEAVKKMDQSRPESARSFLRHHRRQRYAGRSATLAEVPQARDVGGRGVEGDHRVGTAHRRGRRGAVPVHGSVKAVRNVHTGERLDGGCTHAHRQADRYGRSQSDDDLPPGGREVPESRCDSRRQRGQSTI